MLSEAPSGATAACPAAELAWVAADFDRPCEMRLRGWRSGLRAGLFVLAALVACFLVCLLAIVFVLWIRTAPVAMLAPPQARRSGARRGGDPAGGRRRQQQCFLCRGSRAQCEPRQRFFATRQALSNAPARSRPVFPHQEVPLASSNLYTGIGALVGHRYPRFWTKHERARLAGSPAVPLMAALPRPHVL